MPDQDDARLHRELSQELLQNAPLERLTAAKLLEQVSKARMWQKLGDLFGTLEGLIKIVKKEQEGKQR